MPNRDTLVQILSSGGGVETKAALAGGALLAANLWEAYTSLAFAALLVFAVADFIVGVARALNEGGLAAWEDRRAFGAGIKLAVACVIVAVSITIDSLAQSTGKVSPDSWAAFGAGCTIMGGIYLGSIARNANSFFPGIAELIQKARQKEPPHDRRKGDGPDA